MDMANYSKYAKMVKEAAEKGLDLSPEARKARAVEQGYLTNENLKNVADNANDFKLVKVENPPEWHSPNDGDFYEAYLNNSLLMEGDQRRLDQFLQYEIEKGLPGGVQNYGLKRPAYMMISPSKYTNPEFDMNDLAKFYHGSAGDIDQFNPNMLGRNTNAASADHAFFFSNNPKDADYYAQLAKDRQPKQQRAFELMQRLSDETEQSRKFMERYDRYNMEKHGMPSEAREFAERRIERLQDRMRSLADSSILEDQAPSITPVNLRIENPYFVDKRGSAYGDITKHLSEAKKSGNDSVVFFDITDPESSSTHIAVFDPSRIRSTQAIFDPAKKQSRDILAGVAPLGAIGASMQQDEEPKAYAAGGVVKKGLKEALEHLNSYKGQGHHDINTEKGREIQELMMKELGEEAIDPMEVLRFNYGAFDDVGNEIAPQDLKVGDILSAKNLTSTYGLYDDDMLEEIASNLKLNDIDPHAFRINVEPGAKYIDVESQLKKLYGKKFSDHEDEIILAPGLRYMIEAPPELKKAYDGSPYHEYFLKHLPESEREEFPELFDKPIKGYIASALFGLPALQDEEPQGYAKGGFVEAKLGNYEDPTPLDQDNIDDLRTAYLNWLHDATLGSDETTKATIGAFLAKGTRPELFEDISLDDLIAAAHANQQYERERLSEDNPLAALSGGLATMPLFMAMGGNSFLGQASTNMGAGAINRYMDEEDPFDSTSLAIEAGLPAAIKYWKPALKAATLSLPALARSDNSLFNLENLAHSSAAP